jgi:hypothetical protein
MRGLGSIGLAMILAFVFLESFPPMALAVFVAGATLASISPLSLALQGVVTEQARHEPGERYLQRVLRRRDASRPPDIERDLSSLRRVRQCSITLRRCGWLSCFSLLVFASDDPRHREFSLFGSPRRQGAK